MNEGNIESGSLSQFELGHTSGAPPQSFVLPRLIGVLFADTSMTLARQRYPSSLTRQRFLQALNDS